nr:MAG TPA: hypothetical protein [Bacteriophage sp.]DAV11482.1 MAG TPA: hypothetical protein [Caudoviricetes sp.]
MSYLCNCKSICTLLSSFVCNGLSFDILYYILVYIYCQVLL